MFKTRRIQTLRNAKSASGDLENSQHAVYFPGDNGDGMNLGVELASTFAGDFSTSQWLWSTATDGSDSGYIWLTGSTGNINYLLVYEDDAYYGVDSANANIASSVWNTHRWNHIVTSYDDTNNVAKTFLNGIEVDSDSLDKEVITDGVNLTVGAGTNLTDYNWKGYISDFAIYNNNMTINEVKTIYNNKAPFNHMKWQFSKYLVGWWQCGDGKENAAGTTIYDMSTNSNNFTLRGNVAIKPYPNPLQIK